MFGEAAVHGFEGNDVGAPISVAACMKHYMGYSFPVNGKDRSPALIPDPYLREYFLPPFRAAVKEHARELRGTGVAVALSGPWPAYNFIA